MRQVLTYQDIPLSGELQVPIGTVITPSARDLAAERGVKIVPLPASQIQRVETPEKTVVIGADHGGFRLKEQLKGVFAELGLLSGMLGWSKRSRSTTRTSPSK